MTAPSKPSTRKTPTRTPVKASVPAARKRYPLLQWFVLAWALIATAYVPLIASVTLLHAVAGLSGLALLIVASVALYGRARVEFKHIRGGRR